MENLSREQLESFAIGARASERPIDRGVLEQLHAAGLLPTDGSVQIPLTMLWYQSRRFAAWLELATRGETEMLELRTTRSEHGFVEVERLKWRNEIADVRRRGPWVRFDRADRIACRCGLNVRDAGEPIFSRFNPTQTAASIAHIRRGGANHRKAAIA